MTDPAAPAAPQAPAPPEGFVAAAAEAAPTPPTSAVTVRRRPRLTETDAWPGLVLSWFAVIFVAVALFSVLVPVSASLYGVPVAAAFGVALLAAGSLPLAMRWAWPGAIAGLGGQAAFFALAVPPPGAPWPISVPMLLALCAGLVILALRGRFLPAVVLWGGTVFGSIAAVLPPARAEEPSTIAASFVTGAAVSAGVLGLAWLLRVLRARVADTLEAERRTSASEHERRLVAEERTRIARELHDVVAHRMSIVQVQATSAPYRLSGLDEAATAEFGEIAANARAAMAEMRELLAVLRDPDAEAETAPQPGFAEIGPLVSSVRRAGLVVDARIVTTAPVSTAVGQAAYRIVQEALSNVLRHAPGAEAAVEVHGDGTRLLVEVVNTPAADSAGRDRAAAGRPDGDAGHGLLGMRERARLVGGTIETGPTESGGFRVAAVLPVIAEANPGGTAR
ncbi:sensor histidine kinase [Agromyces mediolanus]|uniref:sensor histidine kinase n=1 Tax=Agromyces mediolanus TaxID=41986 RepID=UPI001E393DB0|nr:histidine kinase [Agromyces mediolanus]MCD1570841.1 sensor histidine kinase [Agromyces mediolanus]